MRPEPRPIPGNPVIAKLSAPRFFAPLLIILTALIAIWFKDYGFPTNDEGAMLAAGAKLARGGVFYRDIDAYPFPGAHYLLSFAMRIFGEHFSVGRWLAAGVFCGIVSILYFVSLRLLDRTQAALFSLSLISLKFFAWPAFNHYIYADVALLFACGSVLAFIRYQEGGRKKWIVAAGMLAGCALLTKQNLGMYLIFASLACLTWLGRNAGLREEQSRRPRLHRATFLLGAAVPVVAMAGYFAQHGQLLRMLYSGFIRPFTGYLPTSSISFLVPLEWWKLGSLYGPSSFSYFVSPYWEMLLTFRLPGIPFYPNYWLLGEVFTRVAYTAVVVSVLGTLLVCLFIFRSKRPRSSLLFLGTYGVLAASITLSAFPRADLYHILSVFPVILLTLFGLIRWLSESVHNRVIVTAIRWTQGTAVFLMLGVAAALSTLYLSHHTYHIKLKRMDLYVQQHQAWITSVVQAIDDHLDPYESIFVYGNEAYYYFLTGRFSPWPFFQLYPGQTGADEGAEVASKLAGFRTPLVISGASNQPGLPPLVSYTSKLQEYIRAWYRYDPFVFQRYPVKGEISWAPCDIGAQAYFVYYYLTGRFSPWPHFTLYPSTPWIIRGKPMLRLYDPLRSPYIKASRAPGWRLMPPGRHESMLNADIGANYWTSLGTLELYPPYSGRPEPRCLIALQRRRAIPHFVY